MAIHNVAILHVGYNCLDKNKYMVDNCIYMSILVPCSYYRFPNILVVEILVLVLYPINIHINVYMYTYINIFDEL